MSSVVVFYLDKDPVPSRRAEFYRTATRIARRKNAALYPVHTAQQCVDRISEYRDQSISHLIFVCHGGATWLIDPERGFSSSRIPSSRMMSVYSLAQILAPKMTHAPLISLAACLCGRSPHWYFVSTYGRALSAWGTSSYKEGGSKSFAGLLRDALLLRGVHPTIRSHTAAGHCTALPLIRQHSALLHSDGHSLFSQMLGPNVSFSRGNRARWVALVRGALAERLLLFDDEEEINAMILRKWGK